MSHVYILQLSTAIEMKRASDGIIENLARPEKQQRRCATGAADINRTTQSERGYIRSPITRCPEGSTLRYVVHLSHLINQLTSRMVIRRTTDADICDHAAGPGTWTSEPVQTLAGGAGMYWA